MKRTINLLTGLFIFVGLTGAALAAPTTLTLVEGAQDGQFIEIGVELQQADPELRPVLADLGMNFDSGSLQFVRVESLVASKAPFGSVVAKGKLRVTMTGFNLSKVTEGPILRIVFKKVGTKKTASIGFSDRTKVAPKTVQRVLKLGPTLTIRLSR